MSLHIDNLVLEVTRKCNMRCQHCLRGNAQRMDMPRHVMFRTLRDVSSIHCLTLTGGEPSMVPGVLEELRSEIICSRVEINYFYVVTNAHSTRNRSCFIEFLDWLHDYTDEPEMNALVVSQDQFHTAEHEPKWNGFVNEWGEPLPYFHREERQQYIINVLNEGRAEELHTGTANRKEQRGWELYQWEEEGEIQVMDNELYVSANGNVTSCCDMAFKRIDREAYGNVLKEDLETIILRHGEWSEQSIQNQQIEEVAA